MIQMLRPMASPFLGACLFAAGLLAQGPTVLCGVDVLARDEGKQLQGCNVGLVTNHTGLAADGRRTIDVLAKLPSMKLVAIFSPEHGLQGKLD